MRPDPFVENGAKTRKVLPIETVAASDIRAIPVTWLWDGWIAKGFLNLITGPPGAGKSTALYDLAARVSREGGSVVIATAEDHLEAVVRPRLEAAGAILDRVHIVTGDMSLPADVERIEARALEVGAVLITVDPLVAFLDGGIDSHKDASVRQALRPLAGIAERVGAAVVVVVHTNKTRSDDPLYRISGSGGFAAAARHVLLACADPADEDQKRHVLAVVKSNLAEFPPPIAYVVETMWITGETEQIKTSRIVWGEELIGMDPRSLLRAPMSEEERGALGEALEFLRATVTGPIPAAEVEKAAKKAKISSATLYRARTQLGIKSERTGFGESGEWTWSPKISTKDFNTSDEILKSLEHPATTSAEEPKISGFVDTRSMDADEPVCEGCGGRMVIIELGQRRHPACSLSGGWDA